MQRMQRWLACLLCCFSFGSMAENIGVSELAVSSRFSDRLVMARIWYPAGENAAGERVSVGGNAVFAGVAAQADAAVSAGRFPLVVISHGGLQSAPDNISWLAAALAGQGYLVAVVNAPQVRGSNMTPPDELWLRPLDISAAIDHSVPEHTPPAVPARPVFVRPFSPPHPPAGYYHPPAADSFHFWPR